MAAVFETIARMESRGRKILALGDMFELGEDSLKLHYQVIENALKIGNSILLLMGDTMRKACLMLSPGLRERALLFDSHSAVSRYLTENIKSGDLVLVKGSRGMRMEKILEEI